MSAKVTGLEIDSSNDYATVKIRISRGLSSERAKASDLPKDARDALVRWLADWGKE